jgi:hypothetical protein
MHDGNMGQSLRRGGGGGASGLLFLILEHLEYGCSDERDVDDDHNGGCHEEGEVEEPAHPSRKEFLDEKRQTKANSDDGPKPRGIVKFADPGGFLHLLENFLRRLLAAVRNGQFLQAEKLLDLVERGGLCVSVDVGGGSCSGVEGDRVDRSEKEEEGKEAHGNIKQTRHDT